MAKDKDFVTLASGDWDALQAAMDRFETAWETGTPPKIEDFLTVEPARRVPLLVELIHVDLERRLRAVLYHPRKSAKGHFLNAVKKALPAWTMYVYVVVCNANH